jgi:PAS domain S-box-containing protein
MSEKSDSQLAAMSREDLLRYCKSLQQDCLQLNERLEFAEERFNVFADNLQAAVYILDEDGRIIYCNPFLTTLTDYSIDELLQLPGFSLIHPDSRAAAVEINQARLRGEDVPNKYDLKLQVKGDKVKWVELHMAKFELQGRNFTLGTSIDITARKASEAELRRSEEKFKAFAENLQVMVYTYDDNGRFTYANKICEEITGFSREELLQMNLEDLFQEDFKKIALSRARQRLVCDGTNPVFHMKIVRKNGESRWVESAGIRLESDAGVTILGNGIDITERMEAELALKESEEKFRLLYEHSEDPMLLLDENGFFDCNQATFRYLEADENEYDWSLFPQLSPSMQPDGQPSDEKFQKMIGLAYKTGHNRFDWFFRTFSGREIWADVSFTVIPFEQREIIFSIWTDITERNRMQEEVLKLRKLESVGRLAGGIAHDFNNLLTGIMGNIEIAGLRLQKQPEKAHKSLEKALKAALRAAGLTQKLLTFAKGGEPIKATAELGEIIRESAEFSLTGSKVALELAIADDLWPAEVDTGQISQVVQNLVINADLEMPDGGTIRIVAENVILDPVQAESFSLQGGSYIKMSVRDQGNGIPEELYDKIFDPFFTTRSEGSGLGLSVIHSIVKKHNGKVSVLSELGSFAEFTVLLPALKNLSKEKD